MAAAALGTEIEVDMQSTEKCYESTPIGNAVGEATSNREPRGAAHQGYDL